MSGLIDGVSSSVTQEYPISGLGDESLRAIAAAIAPVEAITVHKPTYRVLGVGGVYLAERTDISN